MKSIKQVAVLAAVVAVIGVAAPEASAQTPTLTASVNGPNLTVQWTGIPGAAGYEVEVGGAFTGNVVVPASVTFFQVTPPAGTYTIRVRGVAPGIAGPFSATQTITIGSAPAPGPGCQPPAQPGVNVTVTGGTVTISWTPVPGAVGYRLDFSRTPGGTELVQNIPANQTSFSQFVPAVGTFYVRVVVGTACGTASTGDVAFTIAGVTPGSGPRTPDPAPGTIIQRASLGYARAIIIDFASRYRGELINSCREHGGNNDWLFLVLQELRKRDTRWGLNDKRGHRGDLSQDIISYNPTNRPDDGEDQIYLFDVIGAHCGNNPTWNFEDVTDPTWSVRGNPACGTFWCGRWTIDPYLRRGFQP
jgi:hypothetical protein